MWSSHSIRRNPSRISRRNPHLNYAVGSAFAEGPHQAPSFVGLGWSWIPERSPIYAEGRFTAFEDSESAFTRHFRWPSEKHSEAGQYFPKRMAPESLGGCELRRLNALQSWQRLAAFQLKFDPAFQHLTQCLCGRVARFAISPSTRKIAQFGINSCAVVDLLVPRGF